MIGLLSCIARVAPGQIAALVVLWLCWAVGAPLVVGHRPLPAPIHQCPWPVVMDVVRCPPPHEVTGQTVSCLQRVEYDLCARD